MTRVFPKPLSAVMQHRHGEQAKPSNSSDVTLPRWLRPQSGQKRCVSAAGGRDPAGIQRLSGSKWGWHWSCWCRYSSSGRFAPRWGPAGPSLLRKCRSTPAGGGQHKDRWLRHMKDLTLCFTWQRDTPHHEGWYKWLLELGFEGVHQLLGFGVVERQYTCRERGRQNICI